MTNPTPEPRQPDGLQMVRRIEELPLTPFSEAAPVRDELMGEQTILTYSEAVGVWSLEFFESGWEFPVRWLGESHWIDITSMWPGVTAQVTEFYNDSHPASEPLSTPDKLARRMGAKFVAEEWDGPLTAEEQAMIDAAWEKHKAATPTSEPLPDVVGREHIETLNWLAGQYLPGGPRDVKGAIRAAVAALSAMPASNERVPFTDVPEAVEAVQRLLERGKATVDRDGYLTVVPASSGEVGQVVAWLREQMANIQPTIVLGDDDSIYLTEFQRGQHFGLREAADAIERGDHLSTPSDHGWRDDDSVPETGHVLAGKWDRLGNWVQQVVARPGKFFWDKWQPLPAPPHRSTDGSAE